MHSRRLAQLYAFLIADKIVILHCVFDESNTRVIKHFKHRPEKNIFKSKQKFVHGNPGSLCLFILFIDICWYKPVVSTLIK